MAEEAPKTPAVPPADPNVGGGTPPKSDPNDGGKMVPHARLNEEIDKRKAVETELANIKQANATKAEEDLKKNKEFETLYEQEKNLRIAESKKAREAVVRAAFVSKANGKNIVNLDDAFTLAQPKLADLKVAEDGVTVEGLTEIIDQLVKDKPYLVSKGSAPVGNPTNPAPAGGGQQPGTRIYTHAEISSMSQAEFDKNKDDINKAQLEGRIRN